MSLDSSEPIVSTQAGFGTVSLHKHNIQRSYSGIFGGKIKFGDLYLAINPISPPNHTIKVSTENISELKSSVDERSLDDGGVTCAFCGEFSEDDMVKILGRYSIYTHERCLQAAVKYIDDFVEEHSNIFLSYEI